MVAADQKLASRHPHSTDPVVEAPVSCTARGLQKAHDIGLLKYLFPKVSLYTVSGSRKPWGKAACRIPSIPLRWSVTHLKLVFLQKPYQSRDQSNVCISRSHLALHPFCVGCQMHTVVGQSM